MTAALLFLATLLVTLSSVVHSAQIPCTGDDCTNLNIFLGPRWGAKSIRIPNPPNFGVPGDNPTVKNATEHRDTKEVVEDGSAVQPTDWINKSEDTSSDSESGSESSEDTSYDEGFDDDDATKKPNTRVPEPSPPSLENIAEVNKKIIDWVGDVSPKFTVDVIQPTRKPTTTWVAKTERSPPRVEFQDDINRFDEETPISKVISTTTHNPVVVGDGLDLDYSDDYREDLELFPDGFYTTKSAPRTWISVNNLNELFENGALNLTGYGLSGEQAKAALGGLSADTKHQLTRLSLARNQLTSLPALTFPVELEYSLLELHLDDNPLHTLDSVTRFELSRLGNLKVLSLARTGLQSLESLYIPSLEALNLSGNRLTALPWSLDGFRALQHLDLSQNLITTLSGPPGPAYESLRALDLSHNGLQYVWNHPFQNMISLDVLYLNDNNLQYVMQIEDIPEFVTLFLRGNRWECSCPLVEFIKEQSSWRLIPDRGELLCTDENIKVPWPMASLRPEDMTVDCPRPWDWVRLPYRRLARWCGSHGLRSSTLLAALWWALMVGALLVIWRTLRRYRNSATPYTILDDKH